MLKISEKLTMDFRDQCYAVTVENGSINIYFENIAFKKTYRFTLANTPTSVIRQRY